MKVTVLGAGVIGLTVAMRLLERGHHVRVVARELPPQTTSDRAAAVWYPFAAAPDARVQAWAKDTFAELDRLSRVALTGVSHIELTELFDDVRPAPWWGDIPRDFRIVGADDLPAGYASGFRATVPLVETPVYLPWLLARLRAGGVVVECVAISNLEEAAGGADALVNAAGLGAARLVPGEDELYALRGQAIRVAGGRVARALVDETGHHALAYVVPRSRDILLGGTATPLHDLSDAGIAAALVPDPAIAETILAACRALNPGLEGCPILSHEVGLRPARSTVRFDRERLASGLPVVHCYGHGGSGFTLSWGCATAVCRLLEGAPEDSGRSAA